MDFDQTCIDTMLGGGTSRLDLGDLANFQGHNSTLKCPKYGFHVLSSELVDVF